MIKKKNSNKMFKLQKHKFYFVVLYLLVVYFLSFTNRVSLFSLNQLALKKKLKCKSVYKIYEILSKHVLLFKITYIKPKLSFKS